MKRIRIKVDRPGTDAVEELPKPPIDVDELGRRVVHTEEESVSVNDPLNPVREGNELMRAGLIRLRLESSKAKKVITAWSVVTACFIVFTILLLYHGDKKEEKIEELESMLETKTATEEVLNENSLERG